MATKPTNPIHLRESGTEAERPTHDVRLAETGESIGTLRIPEWAGKTLATDVEIVPLDPIIGEVTLSQERSTKKPV